MPVYEAVLTFVIFQISTKTHFQAQQNSSYTFLDNFRGCNLQKLCGKTSRFIQRMQEIYFVKSGNFFHQKFEKLQNVIFGPM